MPEKLKRIWPETLNEMLPPEVKTVLKAEPPKPESKPLVKAKAASDESDLDMDELEENEWG